MVDEGETDPRSRRVRYRSACKCRRYPRARPKSGNYSNRARLRRRSTQTHLDLVKVAVIDELHSNCAIAELCAIQRGMDYASIDPAGFVTRTR